MSELETKSKSRLSKYLCVPIINGKAKSSVGKRIVKIIEQSDLCPSSPLLKKLLLQNVHVFCIVVETSGSQSLQILYASAPYIIKILSKSNPKLKSLLEDEKLVSYVKFFQDTDLEPVLESLCTATVYIRKGVKKLYPIVSIQFSRDVVLLGESTIKSAIRMLYTGLLQAVRFICEDLPPFVKSVCAKNVTLSKWIAKNLPVVAFAAAKGFVILGLLLRRVLRALLKAVKMLANFCRHTLRDTPYYEVLVRASEEAYLILKRLACILLSSDYYKLCKRAYGYYVQGVGLCVKEFFPLLWVEYLKLLRLVAPMLKKLVLSVIHSPSTAYVLAEDNLETFVNVCRNITDALKVFIQNLEPYSRAFYHLILEKALDLRDIVYFLLPYIYKCTSYILSSLVQKIVFFIQNSEAVIQNFRNTCTHHREILKRVLSLFSKLLKALGDILKSAVKTYSVGFVYCAPKIRSKFANAQTEIQPLVYPIIIELNSCFTGVTGEIIAKSSLGMQKVVPSVWNSVTTITPPILSATHEVVTTFRNSVIVIFPDLLRAVEFIRPDITNAFTVVLDDGSKACIQVSAASYHSLLRLGVVTKAVATRLPTSVKAIGEVTATTSLAAWEVSKAGFKTRARVSRDCRSAVCVVSSSIYAAESEIVSVFNEIVHEIHLILQASAETKSVLVLFAKGRNEKLEHASEKYFKLNALVKSFVEKLLAHVSCYQSLVDTVTICIVNLFEYISSSISTASYDTSQIENTYLIVKNIVSLMVCKLSVFIDTSFDYLCSEIFKHICLVTPKLWNILKDLLSTYWKLFCDFISEYFAFLEHALPEIWQQINKYCPVFWESVKNMTPKAWEQVCNVSPVIWNSFSTTVPVIWRYNRSQVQFMWDLHLQTFDSTWELVVPLSASSWAFAEKNCPKLWLSLCDNSKMSWKQMCDGMESGWDVITRSSASSWEVLVDSISKSWNTTVRPLAKSACCNSVLVLTKSIEVPLATCHKTRNVMLIFHDEISGTYVSLLKNLFYSKFGEDYSKTPETLNRRSRRRVFVTKCREKWSRGATNILNFYQQVASFYTDALMSTPLVQNWISHCMETFGLESRTGNFGQYILYPFMCQEHIELILPSRSL